MRLFTAALSVAFLALTQVAISGPLEGMDLDQNNTSHAGNSSFTIEIPESTLASNQTTVISPSVDPTAETATEVKQYSKKEYRKLKRQQKALHKGIQRTSSGDNFWAGAISLICGLISFAPFLGAFFWATVGLAIILGIIGMQDDKDYRFLGGIGLVAGVGAAVLFLINTLF